MSTWELNRGIKMAKKKKKIVSLHEIILGLQQDHLSEETKIYCPRLTGKYIYICIYI